MGGTTEVASDEEADPEPPNAEQDTSVCALFFWLINAHLDCTVEQRRRTLLPIQQYSTASNPCDPRRDVRRTKYTCTSAFPLGASQQ